MMLCLCLLNYFSRDFDSSSNFIENCQYSKRSDTTLSNSWTTSQHFYISHLNIVFLVKIWFYGYCVGSST
ncbi:Uncharacterized protein TCM_020523 [Theobroma cacao]|uniref:Uncharacterized protein n=1 Tax=Theobroma cacao TaxID=3641 RepID=A0A061ETC0_THECC|nr:Uncharacterized protein TCM_020523 [Theobroma cacao]